jgi:hypothetical protein
LAVAVESRVRTDEGDGPSIRRTAQLIYSPTPAAAFSWKRLSSRMERRRMSRLWYPVCAWIASSSIPVLTVSLLPGAFVLSVDAETRGMVIVWRCWGSATVIDFVSRIGYCCGVSRTYSRVERLCRWTIGGSMT